MADSWIILAVVLGVALLAAAVFIGISTIHKPAPLPTELIPSEIEGFTPVNRFDHVEPIFEGEQYSALTSFAPLPDSKFQEKVERLGINVYVFENKRSAKEVMEMLLSHTYSRAEKVKIGGQTAELFLDESSGQVGVMWQQQLLGQHLLYQVVVTGQTGEVQPAEGYDMEALKSATLLGAEAVTSLFER